MSACNARRLSPELHAIVRGLAAYGSAEIASRAVRVVAVVVIARRIDAIMLGTAALTLSLFELIRVLANAGIGQRIVAAADDELDAICNRARGLFWIWCTLVAGVQLLAAAILAFGGLATAAAMLAALSGVYLTMPPGLVQIFLLMRARRMAAAARIAATQTIADHALTMLLAVIWPSAWAIVLPKLLTAPLWTLLARRARPWRAIPAAGTAPVAEFVRYGAGVLGSELGAAARAQLGNLIVGALLGVHALGTFYFALNAGLGITAAFVTAFAAVLFPQLCAARDREGQRRYRHALALGLGLFLPVAAAQILLAPVYVPILFGARWAHAAPLVSLLGLAALPLVAGAATTAWLRATGRTGTDALVNLVARGAALAGLAIGAAHGLAGAAAGYVGGLAVVLVPAALAFATPHRSTLQERFA